jgi:hypothetical protein
MERWLVKNKEQAEFFIRFIRQEAEEGRERFYTIVHANRTNKQSNTLHLWLRRLAEAMNDAGYSQPHPWGKMQIPYSETSVKDLFFRPIIRNVYNKDSTRELTTKELSEAMEILLDAINEHTGVYVPIPQED